MAHYKSGKLGVNFEQFYAAVLLQRVIHGRNAMGLTEARWRIVWTALSPAAREALYLTLGVGLSQDQVSRDIGCTRANVNNLLMHVIKSMRKLVTFEHCE